MENIDQKDYPRVAGEKGIDFSQIHGDQLSGTIRSESGRNIHFDNGFGYLRLTDGNYEMSAEVDDYGDLKLRLFTKDIESGQRHPDMYASRFLEVVLTDFEKKGIEINEVRDIWTNGTDTYDRYKKVLVDTGSKVEAAKSNLLEPLKKRGFTEISDEGIREIEYPANPESNCVYARFKRPQVDSKAA